MTEQNAPAPRPVSLAAIIAVFVVLIFFVLLILPAPELRPGVPSIRPPPDLRPLFTAVAAVLGGILATMIGGKSRSGPPPV